MDNIMVNEIRRIHGEYGLLLGSEAMAHGPGKRSRHARTAASVALLVVLKGVAQAVPGRDEDERPVHLVYD
jgi:hypothetical protein